MIKIRIMNKKFTTRLTEYLDSECSDFGLEYDFKWCEDTACCEVEVKSNYGPNKKELNFRYDEKGDHLLIELSEDSFYETREYDESVKYFWMLISPSLFPNN